MHLVTKAQTLYYGIEGEGFEYRAVEIARTNEGSSFTVLSNKGIFKVTLPVPGLHNVMNALAATAVAKELGLEDDVIQKGLANLQVSEKRLNIIKMNGFLIIDDTYNASPASMKASLDVLNTTDGKRKIAVLADMLELGASSGEMHRDIGEYAAKTGINRLFAFGEFAREYAIGINSISKDKGEYFSSKQTLMGRIKLYIQPGDVILVKGSRGMRMEEVVAALTNYVVSEERAEV
jgi:UDP-N-acetylmuramoyl-tripeptide--D-alanyl-D-alanine ligase